MFRTLYDQATEDLGRLREFWDNDPYEEQTWEIGNRLISKYIVAPGLAMDLGCGIYPHVELTDKHKLLAVDFSFDSLRVSQSEYNNRDIIYLCSDALCLPLTDSSVRYVVAVGELWNHVSPRSLMKEIDRVLRPGGIAIFDVSMKLCFYNLYIFIGALLGMKYAQIANRADVIDALRKPFRGSEATWQVTPWQKATVMLPTAGEVLRVIRMTDLQILERFGTVVASDIVPPPIQKRHNKSAFVRLMMRWLSRIDELIAGREPFWRFGGNCFFVVRKEPGTRQA